MRSYNTNYAGYSVSDSAEVRFTIRLDFADSFLDPIYLTSHTGSATPGGAAVYPATFISGSAVTQDIAKRIATIGSMSLEFIDDGSLTAIIGDRLTNSSKGLRLKRVQVYKGYAGLVWADYELVATQVIGKLTYEPGKYTISCDDIQRTAKKDIFDVKSTELTSAIDENSLVLSVLSSDDFVMVAHGPSYEDASNSTVGYLKIDDEIIRYSAKSTGQFTSCERGRLGTVKAKHESGAKVTEVVYLDLPVIKLIYAILTGSLYGQSATLPSHWHLGIDLSYVDAAAFTGIGNDLWNTGDDTVGAICRFVLTGKEDGKLFIENELLPMVGCFVPIKSDGKYSLRRRSQVLETSPANVSLNDTNIISNSALVYDYSACRNQIEIQWHWSHVRGDFTRKNSYLFSDSINKYKATAIERLKFKGLYTHKHTNQHLTRIVEYLADRLAYPPITTSIELLPTLENIEVGDVVRFEPSGILDHTTQNLGYLISRSFEVQRVSTDLITGKVSIDVASSSQPAPIINFVEAGAVVSDAYYTARFSEGTNISTLAGYSAGALTANVSITGGTTTGSGIWYHNGDLTINTGVTLTISQNVWLIVKGFLTVNGTINGIGGGITGAAATDNLTGVSVSGGYLGAGAAMGGVGWSAGYSNSTTKTGFARAYDGGKSTSKYVTSIPVLNMINNGTSITEINTLDLRGTGGAAGGAGRRYATQYFTDLLRQGKAGGNGGAGLLVLSKGMSLGGSSSINLSGADGTACDTIYTANAGSGSGGLPGAMYVCLDGTSSIAPDITNRFTATRGACPRPPSNAEFVTFVNDTKFVSSTSSSPHYYSVFKGDEVQYNYANAAARIQYLPKNLTPVADPEDAAPLPPTSPSVASGNAELDTRTDGTVIERVKVTWTASTDANVDRYQVESKLSAASDYELSATLINRTATVAYISKYKALDVIDIRISSINKYDKRSTWATVLGHTVAGKSAPPTAITGATVTPLSQAMRLTITAAQQCPDKDLASIEIWYHTANDRSLVTASNKIAVAAKPSFLWESLVPATAGTTYYFWFRPIDTSGLAGGFYPSSSTGGIPATGILSVTDSNGNLLLSGDGGGALQTLETGFRETFESVDALSLWENYAGSGELSIVSVADSMSGGKVLRVGNNSGNDQAWLIHRANIPFDQNKLYKLTVVLRRTFGSGVVYAGWAGIAADGTTLVNVEGNNSHASQHYHAISNIAPGASFTTYVGYTKGVAATGTYAIGTLSTPGKIHQNVRYIRPLLLVNYSAVAGQVDVDSFTVELAADSTQVAINSGIDLSVGYLKNAENINLDFTNKSISINSPTFGNAGFQVQYNGGTPKMYVGDGANKFMRFDGTNFDLGRDCILRGTYSYNSNALYYYEQWRSLDSYTLTATGVGITPVLYGGDFIWCVIDALSSSVVCESSARTTVASNGRLDTLYFNNNIRFKTKVSIQLGNTNSTAWFGIAINSSGKYIYFAAARDGTGMRFGVSTNDGATPAVTYASGTYGTGAYYIVEVVFTPATDIKLYVDSSLVLTVSSNLPSGTDTSTECKMGVKDTTSGTRTSSYIKIGDYKIERVA